MTSEQKGAIGLTGMIINAEIKGEFSNEIEGIDLIQFLQAAKEVERLNSNGLDSGTMYVVPEPAVIASVWLRAQGMVTVQDIECHAAAMGDFLKIEDIEITIDRDGCSTLQEVGEEFILQGRNYEDLYSQMNQMAAEKENG